MEILRPLGCGGTAWGCVMLCGVGDDASWLDGERVALDGGSEMGVSMSVRGFRGFGLLREL
jgi:hypothetical protein